MGLLDWMIVIFFLAFIIGMGIYSMRYVKGITDFLACGRVCGRYVISVADVANGLALITMIGMVEAGYSSGFAYGFWGAVTMPVGLLLSLTGFVAYRFRQTKAMSFGQFIEMRYSRKLRIFASTMRSISEMLANMILPALAGRFFICLLDLPERFSFCGLQISTFVVVMLICLTLAISMILMGGSVTLVITDTMQGLVAYPVLALFVIFILWNFSWTQEIMPVMLDRAPGESFLNPYDVQNLRDFNVFLVLYGIFTLVLNRGIGLGAGGGSSAAKSPHEQKMAGVLGTWRNGFMSMFYILLVLTVITFMNHVHFAGQAAESRKELSARVVKTIIADPEIRKEIVVKTAAIPVHTHTIGTDKPLSRAENLDTPYLNSIKEVARAHPGAGIDGKVQEFKTLFHQLMLPTVLRQILPPGMMGLFCMLVILMIISTDDSRIYSASITLSQDLVLPLLKKQPTPKEHVRIVRLVTIGVGIFFFCGSMFMSQLEYVSLFVMIMYGIWAAGAGIVVLGGLYTKFGTKQGAWAALLSGSGLQIIGIIVQRNWGSTVYPILQRKSWDIPVGRTLELISSPFNPFIVWKMDPHKCPVNAVELSFVAMAFSIVMYCLISWLTFRKPFNLDQMLHRGKYNLDGLVENTTVWSRKNFFAKIIGITNEYTLGDKIIAWSVLLYSMSMGIVLFAVIVIWNGFYKWPAYWWGYKYLFTAMIIPGIVAIISTVWFTIGGIVDLRKMFHALKNRRVDELDNGMVEGHLSIVDKAQLEAVEKAITEKNNEQG
ncbi:MAG: sodium:panthothenate symporter [Lentisphaeria bacterium]